ncbi:MAG: hypothetical protein HC822_17565 [Oscillochloris sp.]|nr:hypothetical protein [Oscillochloris sp.]
MRNAHLYGELERTYHELAELDRMKSEFIAIASHELRSPLALVIGYTQMLRDRNEGQTREYAQRALEGATKITQIVDDLTKLRQNDIQRPELKRETVAIDGLVRQVIERLNDDAAQRAHTVTLQTPGDELIVAVERDKFLLMVGNLLSNAITFTPPNGNIHVRLTVWRHAELMRSVQAAAINPSLRRLDTIHSGEWAIVEVYDTGIGIPREHQSRIFERFYQVAHSLTRTHGGVGLGLALVAESIMHHQGLVWMEANTPQGSCFRLAIPLPAAATGL